MKEVSNQRGCVITCQDNKSIMGGVFITKTGKSGCIPENIQDCSADYENHRGIIICKLLMKIAIKQSKGDTALHVEADNPAKMLCEHLRFQNKYLEMRYVNSKN